MRRKTARESTFLDLIPMKTAEKDLSDNPAYRRRFHVMTKIGGSRCNIDCQYCFYLHKEGLLHQPKQPKMDDATLENFIRSYIQHQDGSEIIFSWQGGEPTLLGVDYFRKIVLLQKKHQPAGVNIENDLQTNGILINDEWCQFLKENNFLVGLSIDGPAFLHDKYRVTRSGKPTHHLVMQAANLFKQYGVRFNALTVVNRHNAQHPLAVYQFLSQELGATYIQFIPCVEPNDFKTTAPQFWDGSMAPRLGEAMAKPGHPMSVVTDWSVNSDDWGQFLIAIFEYWINNDLGRVLVNYFETAVAQTMGKPSQLCVTSEICGKGLALEHNGDVYSCDHYVYPEYHLGNVNKNELKHLAFSIRQHAFGISKRDSLPEYCRQCQHLKLCWGECPKHRLIKSPDGEEGLSYLCSGFKAFYDYSSPILVGLTTLIRSGKSIQDLMR